MFPLRATAYWTRRRVLQRCLLRAALALCGLTVLVGAVACTSVGGKAGPGAAPLLTFSDPWLPKLPEMMLIWLF